MERRPAARRRRRRRAPTARRAGGGCGARAARRTPARRRRRRRRGRASRTVSPQSHGAAAPRPATRRRRLAPRAPMPRQTSARVRTARAAAGISGCSSSVGHASAVAAPKPPNCHSAAVQRIRRRGATAPRRPAPAAWCARAAPPSALAASSRPRTPLRRRPWRRGTCARPIAGAAVGQHHCMLRTNCGYGRKPQLARSPSSRSESRSASWSPNNFVGASRSRATARRAPRPPPRHARRKSASRSCQLRRRGATRSRQDCALPSARSACPGSCRAATGRLPAATARRRTRRPRRARARWR